jgi:hypothetical protein
LEGIAILTNLGIIKRPLRSSNDDDFLSDMDRTGMFLHFKTSKVLRIWVDSSGVNFSTLFPDALAPSSTVAQRRRSVWKSPSLEELRGVPKKTTHVVLSVWFCFKGYLAVISRA